MSSNQHPIATPFRKAGTVARRMTSAKAVVYETVQTLSGTVRAALLAYAMTGSAVASLAIIAAPYLETLVRCMFHCRG
ncbi:hypothetical protein [Bradyrhizobium sp. CB2312]|uniref:hypothetical protein n=1 Tax=Bradyrhizobium sp. CB2312 TaxID=3039155 RepID=UPI0024B05E77|nr:hypothetical protein [Bradyrhizobium sp. CB2312]WFU69285.1 hypothetical protein QA642_28860 [Bradyrhizobium sp. CB2312]